MSATVDHPAHDRGLRVPGRDEAEGRTGTGRGAAVVAVLAVLAGLILAPPLGPGQLPAGAAARIVDGPAEVLRAGSWVTPADGIVRRGEQVRSGSDYARLELRAGELELAPGTRVTVGRDEMTLDTGAVLATVDQLTAVTLDGLVARGLGTFRVDVTPRRRVGVYDGGVAVAAGSVGVAAEAYQEVEVVEAAPTPPAPLRYRGDDRWDVRLLASALAVDSHIDRLETSLASLYGTQLQTPAFYRDFLGVDDRLATALPQLAPRSREGRFGPPAPTLVSVVVARTLVERAALSPEEATEELLTARGAGATWGLILVRRDLGVDELRSAAGDALGRRESAVEQGEAAPVAGPPRGSASRPTPTPTDGPDEPNPTPTPSPSPTPSPTPTPPDDDEEPDPEPSPSPVEDAVDEAEEVVDDVVDTVDELLDPPLPVDPGPLTDPLLGG